MFEYIAENYQWRLKDLKSQIRKKSLEIRYKNESNNESDNESESESESHSESESIKKIPELKPGMIVGKYKYVGKNAIYQEKKN